MKKFTLDDLDDLLIGSAILGSGGGGDPSYDLMITQYLMEKHVSIPIMSISELKSDDFVIALGLIGAPLAALEKITKGRELITVLELVEKSLKRKVTVVMPFEIGGRNAFVPFMAAAQAGLPVLDADMMGRAFPESQMSSCSLYDVSPSPAFIVDSLNNSVIIHAKDSRMLEKIARPVTVTMGSTAAFGYYPLEGTQVAKKVIPKSISKALEIGRAHKESKKAGKDPLEAILHNCHGTYIGSGKIIDIDRQISKGFLYGTVMIQGKYEKIELIFQNEYILAKVNDQIVATTPDILVLLEEETGTPITSESVQFGLRVNLIAIPAPSIWTTPKGLTFVGPREFGYEVDYHPIEKRKNGKIRETFSA